MSEQPGTLETIALELAHLLRPLEDRLDATQVRDLFRELGLTFSPALDSQAALAAKLKEVVGAVGQIPAVVAALISAIQSESIGQIIEKGAQMINLVKNFIEGLVGTANTLKGLNAAALGVTPGELQQFADNLPRKLFDYIIVRNLELAPGLADALDFLSVVERTAGSLPNDPMYIARTLHVDRLFQMFQSPGALLHTLYQWGDNSFNGTAALQKVEHLLQNAGIPAVFDTSVNPPVLDVLFLNISPKTDISPPGLRIAFDDKIKIDGAPTFEEGDVKLELVFNNTFSAGTEILLQPDGAVAFKPPSGTLEGDNFVRITLGKDDGQPIILIGQAGGSRIELKQAVLKAGVGFVWDSAANKAEGVFKITAEVKKAKIVVNFGEGDGFLQKILSGIGLESEFDIGMGFSTQHGVFFFGSSVLTVQLPLHLNLGPIEINALSISSGFKDGGIPLIAAASFKAALGPLQAVVEEIGIGAQITLPENRKGNAGPLDFALRFQPPKGVGLSLDVGVVKGGGYLYFDFDKEEYAGALELSIMSIVTVKAIALITTKMPDGSKGFSLLIIISAEFTGIQLGFGFTLNGVGGLLGLNRTMQLEEIAKGVRTGGINSIMFPKDVIANAPRIISDLRTYFPPMEGRFLIGLMAKIGWGTPTLASLSLGVIVEIPPGKVAILGILKVALPAEEAPLIVIQVNFIGAIEPDKQRLWFFAELFESRVLFISIEGGMGLLVAWGDDANFVLSVGGFHPRFNPPPLPFPVPHRIALDILNTPVSRIRVEAYFAVTSNTVQFGARLELRLGLDEIGIFGHLALDALFQFSPFYFIIEISGSVELKVFGLGLFSIRLELSLEGPTPWRAKGTGTLSLLFFDISADFDVTWGDKEDTSLPPIPVIPLLEKEFNKTENWRAELPKGSNLLVSLRAIEENDGLVLHPVGILVVSQRAVPLDLDIAKIGARKVADAKHFSVRTTTTGLGKKGQRREQFAMGQYLDLKNDEKLSRKGYELQNSGLELSAEGRQTVSSRAVKRTVRYEQIVFDSKYKKKIILFFAYMGSLFTHFLRGNAAAKSALSKSTQKLFVPFEDKVKVQQEGYVVATNFDNKPYSKSHLYFDSEATAYDFMHAQTSLNGDLGEVLHVIPAHEAVGG